MPKYASGKHALAISDRSGLRFPWREMVTEWTGAFVHVSEYEPKQPQLRPKTLSASAISLSKVRTDRTAFPTTTILPISTILIEDTFPLRFRITKREKLEHNSDILCDQIRTIDNKRIISESIAVLTTEELLNIDKQISIILDIDL